MSSILHERIQEAACRIQGYVRHTPLDCSYWLSNEGNAKVYIKWENEQVTCAFKARGAFNKMLSLLSSDESVKTKGVITASSGNHGAACSLVMRKLGIKGVVYSPEYISDAKRSMIEQYGGEVRLYGQDCIESENYARTTAKERQIPYIPPYNDYDVVAGQGTVGVEIHEDLPSVEVVFVAVGGGGLISGIASYLKAVKPDIKVIGCQPEQSAVLYHSVQAGKILDLPSGETLSDGTTGGVEQGSVTLELCKSLVDDWVLVTEQEIGKAVYDVMDQHHKMVEGAAGVAVAAYLKTKDQHEGKTVVIVSCGGNISMERIKTIISLHGGMESGKREGRMSSILHERILEAACRIQGYVRHTPLGCSYWLSNEGNANVYIKWENEQVTGAFKARGAFNKMLSLLSSDESVKTKGVITASSGNHGAACSLVMRKLGINGVVYSPEYISDAKRSMIEQYGGEVMLYGQDVVQAENYARATAKERQIPYIPPYNDYDVIAGQGTVGVEIHEDLPSVEVVFVAVGGGGSVSGIASYLKAVKPDIKVIGCQPEQSAVLYHSVQAGKILDLPSGETLSDGTTGGVEQGSVTLELCKSLVDDWVLVTEQEIGKAVYDVMDQHHKMVEGAAGVAVAAYLKTKDQHEGKTVVIVSCGGNISMERIKTIISLHG